MTPCIEALFVWQYVWAVLEVHTTGEGLQGFSLNLTWGNVAVILWLTHANDSTTIASSTAAAYCCMLLLLLTVLFSI